jgi:hypothetical protein
MMTLTSQPSGDGVVWFRQSGWGLCDGVPAASRIETANEGLLWEICRSSTCCRSKAERTPMPKSLGGGGSWPALPALTTHVFDFQMTLARCTMQAIQAGNSALAMHLDLDLHLDLRLDCLSRVWEIIFRDVFM